MPCKNIFEHKIKDIQLFIYILHNLNLFQLIGYCAKYFSLSFFSWVVVRNLSTLCCYREGRCCVQLYKCFRFSYYLCSRTNISNSSYSAFWPWICIPVCLSLVTCTRRFTSSFNLWSVASWLDHVNISFELSFFMLTRT